MGYHKRQLTARQEQGRTQRPTRRAVHMESALDHHADRFFVERPTVTRRRPEVRITLSPALFAAHRADLTAFHPAFLTALQPLEDWTITARVGAGQEQTADYVVEGSGDFEHATGEQIEAAVRQGVAVLKALLRQMRREGRAAA